MLRLGHKFMIIVDGNGSGFYGKNGRADRTVDQVYIVIVTGHGKITHLTLRTGDIRLFNHRRSIMNIRHADAA
jgi:hypothetical protein